MSYLRQTLENLGASTDSEAFKDLLTRIWCAEQEPPLNPPTEAECWAVWLYALESSIDPWQANQLIKHPNPLQTALSRVRGAPLRYEIQPRA